MFCHLIGVPQLLAIMGINSKCAWETSVLPEALYMNGGILLVYGILTLVVIATSTSRSYGTISLEVRIVASVHPFPPLPELSVYGGGLGTDVHRL